MKLRVDVLNRLQRERGWTETELARRIGISRSRLWRAKLPVKHKEYCSPGKKFISGLLKTFPDHSFDDLFER